MADSGIDYNYKAVFRFLSEYRWVYDFQLTNFFVNKIWKNVPKEWCDVLLTLSTEELNNLPFGGIKDEWPESFKVFIQTALTFSLPRSHKTGTSAIIIDQDMKRGMTLKKQHEVSLMSSIIHDIAQQANCDVLLDIGSGLGYLGQILHRRFGYRVIGFESQQSHTSGAERRSCHNDDQEGIQNVTFELDKGEENMEKFSELVCSLCAVKTCIGSSQDKLPGICESEVKGTLDIPKLPHESVHQEENCCQVCASNVSTTDKCECMAEESTITKDKNNMCTECLKEEGYQVSGQCRDTCIGCHCGNKDTEIKTHQTSLTNLQDSVNICTCRTDAIQKETIQLKRPHQSVSIGTEKSMTFTSSKALMIGLHCCGDLTPTMMEYFRGMHFVRGLCCVSCCYHRMSGDSLSLYNFPISQTAIKAYQEVRGDNPGWTLNTFAMRLAAQETRGRWRQQSSSDHDFHTKNVGYRGILELFLHQKAVSYNKLFRKIAKKTDFTSFKTYVEAASRRFGDESGTFTDIDMADITKLYDEYREKMKYIEPITALQYLLQPVLETLIHMDRATWIKENGLTAEIVPIFDEVISPRNLALISVK